MMPFWSSNGGGLQEIEMLVESTASAEILAGGAVGAIESKPDQNEIKMRTKMWNIAIVGFFIIIAKSSYLLHQASQIVHYCMVQEPQFVLLQHLCMYRKGEVHLVPAR